MNDDHDSTVSNQSTIYGAGVEETHIEKHAYEEISKIPLLSEDEAKEMYNKTIVSDEKTMPVMTDVLVKNTQDAITTYPKQLPLSDGSLVSRMPCLYSYDTVVMKM